MTQILLFVTIFFFVLLLSSCYHKFKICTKRPHSHGNYTVKTDCSLARKKYGTWVEYDDIQWKGQKWWTDMNTGIVIAANSVYYLSDQFIKHTVTKEQPYPPHIKFSKYRSAAVHKNPGIVYYNIIQDVAGATEEDDQKVLQLLAYIKMKLDPICKVHGITVLHIIETCCCDNYKLYGRQKYGNSMWGLAIPAGDNKTIAMMRLRLRYAKFDASKFDMTTKTGPLYTAPGFEDKSLHHKAIPRSFAILNAIHELAHVNNNDHGKIFQDMRKRLHDTYKQIHGYSIGEDPDHLKFDILVLANNFDAVGPFYEC